MATRIIPEKYETLVSTIFYLMVSVIGLILLVANTAGILAAAEITHFPDKFTPTKCLFLFGISVSFMSALIWFGMILGVFKGDDKFKALISRVFIAGVLGQVLAAVGKA